jgi:hypothetical protein
MLMQHVNARQFVAIVTQNVVMAMINLMRVKLLFCVPYDFHIKQH